MSWKKIRSRQQKVGYKTIIIKDFVMPDGLEAEYTTVGREGGLNVATIALTKDNQVVVAYQYRPGPEEMFDEIPGGGVNEGEDLALAAARELLEETGYKSTQPLRLLGEAYRDAYANERNCYYLALNCEKVAEQSLDSGEHVEVKLISIEQLIQNAKSAKMSDSVAVLLAYEQLMRLK